MVLPGSNLFLKKLAYSFLFGTIRLGFASSNAQQLPELVIDYLDSAENFTLGGLAGVLSIKLLVHRDRDLVLS